MLSKIEIMEQVKSVFESLLEPIPFVKGLEFSFEPLLGDNRHENFIATIDAGHDKYRIVGEVKRSLQPRMVHDAIRHARLNCSYISESSHPLIVSEYISPRTAEILIEENISYFDLVGNCRLSFDSVYIEKSGKKSKSSDKRGVKSLFGLKSSRMLRLMLNDFVHPWQVKELSAQTKLSYGQVSNIRRSLLDQEYAIESEEGGIQLTQPDALLNDWRKVYKKNIVSRENNFYSLLNVNKMQAGIKAVIKEAEQEGALVMLNGLSSARWLAPFVKSSTESFYADKMGVEILKSHLKLEAVSMGPNVIIEEPKDAFIFKEAVDCAPGLKCSSAIQTYLDLYIAGGRLQEAAEHIENHILKDKWKNNLKDKV